MELIITKYDMWQYFSGSELNEKYSNVTELTIEGLKKTDYDFLSKNTNLRKISLPDALEIESGFLENNEELEEVYLPQVKIIDSFFLQENRKLKSIDLPNVQKIDSWFMQHNNAIKKINFPELRIIGDNFMCDNEILEEALLPNVTDIGDDFLEKNNGLKNIYIPKLEKKGTGFLLYNSLYDKIKGDVDLSFRKSITEEIKEKLNNLYILANNLHVYLVSIQNNIKNITSEFGKDYGKNSNIYYHDSCFSLHGQINDFLISKLTMEFGDALRELSDLIESTIDFNIYVNDLIRDVEDSIQFDPDVLMEILSTIQTMSDAKNYNNGYDSYTVFENSSSKISSIIQGITQSLTKGYFFTIRLIICIVGNEEAKRLLSRSKDDILKNIAFSVVVDKRFLPYVSEQLNKGSDSFTINELLEIENEIYRSYLIYLSDDFFGQKQNFSNENREPDDSDKDYDNEIKICSNCGGVLDEDNWCDECCEFSCSDDEDDIDFQEENEEQMDLDEDYDYEKKLCPKCGSVLDDENWCDECLDFVEPEKDEIIKALEWLIEDDIERVETLKTKKVDAIFNLVYQHGSMNKSIELYEIPYDELIEGSEHYKTNKYSFIKPVFFEFCDDEYMFDGGLFIKTVTKKEVINGKKVLSLSDAFINFIWNQDNEAEFECIEKSLENNKYKIHNMIKKCPICGEFEYTPDDFSCDICGWEFSPLSEMYKDHQDYENNLSFNEYKRWWKEKRKGDPNFVYSDDMDSYPVESAEIKTFLFEDWEYSLSGDQEVVIRGFNANDFSGIQLEVPSEILGKKVVGIDGGGLSSFAESLIFPNTIKFIGPSVVESYYDIKIYIPKSVEYIAKQAFGSLSRLTLYIERDEIPNTWENGFDLNSRDGDETEIILGASLESFNE